MIKKYVCSSNINTWLQQLFKLKEFFAVCIGIVLAVPFNCH